MSFRALITAVLLACSATPLFAQEGGVGLTAQTDSGRVRGIAKPGVIAFLGLPYAAPPVGTGRWRAPGPAARWTGVRDATASGASCPQVLNPAGGRLPWTPEYLIPGPMSEDCLFVNVWRPASARLSRAPVLFWIHGGGGVEGSNSVPVYDGAALARRGIVVVSLNYRLGVLASLSHPELSREQGGASGNYGLQDIIAALRWTRANAAAFGGDPSRITVAGQSAGSGYVTQLIASPAARGMFVRAITESGSRWGIRAAPLSAAAGNQVGREFATSIGAASIDQLRAAPAERLVKQAADYAASGKGRFGAVLDGKFVLTDPNRAQGAPGFNDTPILSGFNADEESGSDSKYGQWTPSEFAAKRASLFAPLAADAALLYPAASDAEAHKAGILMARENSRATIYEWAKRRAGASRYPIYTYFFQHPHPGATQARYGTFHSSEIPYVFGNLDAPRPFTAADRGVSERMMSRWVNFIKRGSPNAPGLAAWRPFDPSRPALMLLGDREEAEPFLAAEKLKLWDQLAESSR